MKIKVAILESDVNYLGRIISVFSTMYADKLQLYSFSNREIALNAIDKEKIDVFLCDEIMNIQPTSIPQRCSFVYFVDTKDVDSVNNCHAICKYQKAELIYKQILNIYAEHSETLSVSRGKNDDVKMVLFDSPAGGVGTSTVAAACACRYAHMGKKVLYLNLDSFDSADLFFSGEGQYNMSDIIFALKTKKNNLSFKLESCVRTDQSGVFFYSQSQLALDMLELSMEDKFTLISALNKSSLYDIIVVDNIFSLENDIYSKMEQFYSIVVVSDGSVSANLKTKRMIDSLVTLEQSNNFVLTDRMFLFYNRFGSKSGKKIDGLEIRNLGGAPRYLDAQIHQIVNQLSNMDAFDILLQ